MTLSLFLCFSLLVSRTTVSCVSVPPDLLLLCLSTMHDPVSIVSTKLPLNWPSSSGRYKLGKTLPVSVINLFLRLLPVETSSLSGTTCALQYTFLGPYKLHQARFTTRPSYHRKPQPPHPPWVESFQDPRLELGITTTGGSLTVFHRTATQSPSSPSSVRVMTYSETGLSR